MTVRDSRAQRSVLLGAVAFACVFVLVACVAGAVWAAGIGAGKGPVCGTGWVSARTPATYFRVYNASAAQAQTCLKVPYPGQPEFKVTSAAIVRPWGYPNVSSGWEWGRYSCAGRAGACYRYPVQAGRVMASYHPRTTMGASLAPGTYNLSYDLWFNRTDAHPGQDDGAEIMIWLAYPGLDQPRTHPTRFVTLDGVRWGVFDAMVSHNGTAWRYVAYYSVRPRSSAGLWLNPFLRDANGHHLLSREWWLTAVDAGFELVRGGAGNAISRYTLTGLPASR